jgi:soluble cytochrome b562
MAMELSAVMNLTGNFISQMQSNIQAIDNMKSSYKQVTVLADEFQSGNYSAVKSIEQVAEQAKQTTGTTFFETLKEKVKQLREQLNNTLGGSNFFRSCIDESAKMNSVVSEHLNSLKDNIFNMKNLIITAVSGATTSKLFDETIGNSANFEQYQNAFEVMMGSADQAKAKMKELSDYANTTPFELPEVVQAGRTLMTFGLDTEKWIKNAGNLAAATNSNIGDVARAMGNINSGNFGEAFERMRDFGISKAMLEAQGLKFDKSGQYVGSVEEAMTAVNTIVNDKFGGMTEKQGQSFNGLKSTFFDTISAIGRQVGDVAFPQAKDALIGLQTTLNNLSNDGSIDKFANAVGNAISSIATAIPKVITGIGQMSDFIHQNSTAIEASFVAIAAGFLAMKATMVATAIVAQIKEIQIAVVGLQGVAKANAIFTTLFGFGPQALLFVGIIMAISAGAVLIYKNWEPIKQFFSDLWSNFISLAKSAKEEGIDRLDNALESAKKTFEEYSDTIRTVATVLGVIFGPTLIKIGLQAVVAGARMVGSFVASLIMTGAQAVVAGTRLTVSFVATLIRIGAQAVVTGAQLTISLIGALIRMSAQAVITGATLTGQLLVSLIRFAAQGWITVGSIAAMTTAWVVQKTIMLGSVVVTGAMTAAQWALNTAFYGCPVVWIIAAIMAIIAVGVLLYTHWDEIKVKALELWESIKSTFSQFGDLAEQALTWGSDMIDGFINGIKSKIGSVVDAISEVANTIKSYLHFSVPDVGPLTDYQTWMPDFMKGLGDGIKINTHLVTNPIKDLTVGIKTNAKNGLAGGIKEVPVKSQSKGETVKQVNIAKLAEQIIIREEADIDKFATAFANKLIEAEYGMG